MNNLEEQADRAVQAGDLGTARRLLEQAVGGSAPPELLMKLAGLQRASGAPALALATIERALAASPLNFTALLMRATLLDRMASPNAEEAWANALAQKPAEVPAQLQTVVAEGERKLAEWTRAREERLRAAMQASEAEADEDQRWRMQRFRDNVLRKTRVFHSNPTHFFYPGLVEREFHPRERFPWIEKLEASTEAIAAELQDVLAAERRDIVPYVQYAEHEPLDQWRTLNHNPDWSAIHLWQNGRRVEANCVHCPRTMALLAELDQPDVPGGSPNAMFSLLAPHTRIPAHVGVSNTRLVCHLPLIVPPGCWFRVGAETRRWERGKAFVFDDTIEHEAENPSSDLRIVFICDIWHPDLSPVEREAVARLSEAQGLAEGIGL